MSRHLNITGGTVKSTVAVGALLVLMTLTGCGHSATRGPQASLQKPAPKSVPSKGNYEVHFHWKGYYGKPLCGPTVHINCITYFKLYTAFHMAVGKELAIVTSSHCHRAVQTQSEPKVCDYTLTSTTLPTGPHWFYFEGFYITGQGQAMSFTGAEFRATVCRTPSR